MKDYFLGHCSNQIMVKRKPQIFYVVDVEPNALLLEFPRAEVVLLLEVIIGFQD